MNVSRPTLSADSEAGIRPKTPPIKVAVRSLGGTISMTSSGQNTGASPTLNVSALINAAPKIADIATIDAETVATIPSASLGIVELLSLHHQLDRACDEGAEGVVVVQGTDTLEESAYLLDLLWARPEPLVFTGAMRTADSTGADGPSNLLAAVSVAASPDASGRGCLVVMDDDIHHARSVRKMHTTSLSAFSSPAGGPAGLMHEGSVRFYAPASGHEHLAIRSGAPIPKVALIRISLGDDTELLKAATTHYDGVVIEALGGGHVPAWWVDPLLEAAARMPVVLASRTGCGPLLESSYNFRGSEKQLLNSGLVSAGDLDGLKARILLIATLMGEANRRFNENVFTFHSQRSAGNLAIARARSIYNIEVS